MAVRASIAPGKIIITGEYVGIFGEPVTLSSVNLHTRATIRKSGRSGITINSDRFPGSEAHYSIAELLELWGEAQKTYRKYLDTQNVDLLKKYRSEKLLPVSLAVAAGITAVNGSSVFEGLLVTVDSILPIGSGLGSSASVSAAIIGELLEYSKTPIELENLNKLTFLVEKILNGKPSGADNSAVVYGGWLRFKRDAKDVMTINRLEKFATGDGWWIVDGGKPVETTLEMIDKVLRFSHSDRIKFERLIHRDREITEATQKQIKLGKLDPTLLSNSQLVLEDMGVIGERGKKLVRAIWEAGGSAKVSGAGGLRDGVGTILAYLPDEEAMMAMAHKNNLSYRKITLGGVGWHLEQ